MAPYHALYNIPITRYWHYERRTKINGLHPPGIPGWLLQFDWVVGWSFGWSDRKTSPYKIFCHPACTEYMSEYIKNNPDTFFHKPIIVIGGEDTLLSEQKKHVMDTLVHYASGVFYEAKDIYDRHVHLMPIGLTEFYLRGFEEELINLVYTTPVKYNLLLSSWGYWWPSLDTKIEDRHQAKEFSRTCEFVTSGPFNFGEWLRQLHLHRFMLCPRGNGVQTPKMIEAILMGCIPVLTRHPAAVELRRRGFPILIVDNWFDITEEKLLDSEDCLSDEIFRFREILLEKSGYWAQSFSSIEDS